MTLITEIASIVPLSGSGSHAAGAMGGPFVFAPFGFLLMLLLVGAVGYLVLRSTRQDAAAAGDPETDSALETLRRRYATGEIDTEEFQTRKERLLG